MDRFAAAALLVVTTIGAVPAEGAGQSGEKEKIEALIRVVEDLKDATFVRNGTEYDGKAAASHMRRKWKAGGDEIRTARDFIRFAASASSQSGKPYLIRFKDGKEVESGKYLSEKLDAIEKAAAADKA